jgi:deoxyribose-phosphate aldolase
MTATDFAARIDHTILKPEATEADVRKVVLEAAEFKFASACVAPRWVSLARDILAGSGVLVCTVAGFPHGTSKPNIKAIEAIGGVKDGAHEIDVVAHLPPLLAGDLRQVKAELIDVVRAARAARSDVVIKVIVESALLTQSTELAEQRIAIACQAVRESGCDFIKTSTGFHPAGGASVLAVSWMKKHAAGIKVKAAGGIRDLAAALAMIDAGADRLGMSAGVEVVRQLARGEKS